MMPAPVDSTVTIHEPKKDTTPKPRRRLFFFDRVKLLVVLAVVVSFGAALKHSDIPVMSWAEAFRDQLEAKVWVLWVAAFEVLRHLHYFVSEKSGAYHQLWQTKVWGAWNRWWDKRNAWLRYRAQRAVKVAFWLFVATIVFSAMWGLSYIDTLAQAPKRLLYNPFGASGMPWFFQIVFSMLFGVMQFVAIFWFMSRGGVDTYMPDEVTTRFSDVWGQDKVLDKVKENIVFLDKPDEIESKGGYVPGGILLWGPPGTGKTLIAEAIAGETSRPFVFVDPGAFKAMFVGVGVLKVKSLFKKLRKLSLKYGGVIVFFDEADTLGNRGGAVNGQPGALGKDWCSDHNCNGLHYMSERSLRMFESLNAPETTVADERVKASIKSIVMGGMGGMDGSLQALLTELSGLKKPKNNIWRRFRAFLTLPPRQPPKYRLLTIMATNLPEALDEALLRPGRLDRKYHVGYPQLDGRVRTFQGYLDKVRNDISSDQVQRLALMSPKISGAAVKDIINEALIAAMTKGRDFITWPDLIDARVFKVYGVSDGVASTRLEQWQTAVHEACHAVAMYRLRKRETIDVATIEKRGPVGGFVAPVPLEERDFSWRFEMEDDIVTSLASLAGERMFFDADNSVGVGGDLGFSTGMTTGMLTRWGMGETIAAWERGDKKRNTIDERVEQQLRALYERAEVLLANDRWFVLAIAHALVARKTITGEDIRAIDLGTMGVVLDGAWYHRETNRQALEDFHAQALDAHREQINHWTGSLPALPSVGLPPPPPPPVHSALTSYTS